MQRRTYLSTWPVAALAAAFLLSGCISEQTRKDLGWDSPPKQESAAEAPAPQSKPASGTVSRTANFPVAGAVKLVKSGPAEVVVGQSFDYELTVTNTTDLALVDVVVTDYLPADFKISRSQPQAEGVVGGKAKWMLGMLRPKQSETIRFTGSASKPGTLVNCSTVSFTPKICITTQVIQPALALTKSLPVEALHCDPIPMKVTVTNTGTGLARNVKISDNLPSGLTTAKGEKSVTLDAGDLAAGKSRSFDVSLKASKTGTFNNTATATGAGGLKAESSAKVTVRKPVLTITKTGPKRMFIDRNVAYTVTVVNNGDWTAKNTVLEDTLPAGVKFVSASSGGKLEGDKVTWKLGDLPVKGSKQVTVTVMPSGAGNLTNTALAKAYCADPVKASVTTKVEGIPAVLLEVIDEQDPIEVGGDVIYRITVTNQGSAPGTNIKIVVTLEPQQQYVSSQGATRGTARGKTVTFAPLASLAPKAKAVWTLRAKAVDAGDVRLKVSMTTDQIGRPVEETEATNLYK